ncbi:MAG: DUF2752 domain-containing protein [Polyangiaceae bacterium]|nr:DUF2752 domain-containing protein [Polyangiaceae bacterium]
MTRATLAALHGDFATAYKLHPLAFIVVPLFGTYAAANLFAYIRYGVSNVDSYLKGKLIDAGMMLLIIAMLGLWISRFFGAFGGPVPV